MTLGNGMKFCILMAFRESSPFLPLHLPVYARAPNVDGFVFLDTGATNATATAVRNIMDAAGYVKGETYHLHHRAFDWRMDVQQNMLIELAEEHGYDCAYKADPDELLWPEHLGQMRAFFEEGYKMLLLPRFGFMGDRLHYVPVTPYYPNWFPRAFVLNQGVHYFKRLHADLNYEALGWRWPRNLFDAPCEILPVPHMPIYHYGEIAPRRMRALWARNYARIQAGAEPLAAWPTGEEPGDYEWHIPFTGPQPLDPLEIGLYAPFSEEDYR